MSYTIPNKKCPDCGTNTVEELGTAGFIRDGKYHNRHDWRCTSCKKRLDIYDCKCNQGSCKGNFEHHSKDKSFVDGR